MRSRTLAAIALLIAIARVSSAARIIPDFSNYDAAAGTQVEQQGDSLLVRWPIDGEHRGGMRIRLADDDRPLIAEMTTDSKGILRDVDPAIVLTVGTRNLSDRAGWVAFFDNPPQRPFQAHRARLARKSVRVSTVGRQTSLHIGDLTAGDFRGELCLNFWPDARIVRADAILSTEQDSRAILYDAGLVSASPSWTAAAWSDADGRNQQSAPDVPASALAVRGRTIIAQVEGGCIALFPPPHQFFYPLDSADNFGFVWRGRGWRGLIDEAGIGVRQTIEGDKRWVPWINAPPKTQQRLSVFYLLSEGDVAQTLEQVHRYTRDDRYKRLDGYATFTSHYHVEHALDAAAHQLPQPDFVKAFKDRGIDIAHLAEFHVQHTPQMNARRLQLLKTLHDECARLSDDQFLLLPGEEPNVHLGGHWISLFPRPVYWTLQRQADQPFTEQIDPYGTVYHVGSAADVLQLMQAERGLMWTAHPRIKGSFGFPDAYRNNNFFTSDRFLGAAWKAMPADNSLPRLGSRVLDLLDDMNDWGATKYAVGEVDVFKIDSASELYGHMNVNYVRLAELPQFRDGWTPLLNALRRGDFFVTTGEVLLPRVEIDPAKNAIRANIEWTFPLAFAELITSDGVQITRKRIDLSDTSAFGSREFSLPVSLTNQKWVRLEIWDIATNGAFTQPKEVK